MDDQKLESDVSSLDVLYEEARSYDGIYQKVVEEFEKSDNESRTDEVLMKYFGPAYIKAIEVDAAISQTLSRMEGRGVEHASGAAEFTVIPKEEEILAKKLRNCCDAHGKERREMLYESAGFFLELGKLYLSRTKIKSKYTSIREKENFIKAAALVTGARIRFEMLGKFDDVATAKTNMSQLHEDVMIAAGVTGEPINDILEFSSGLKKTLVLYRKLEADEIDKIVFISGKDNDVSVCQKERQKFEMVRELSEINTNNYIRIMKSIAEKCEKILGNPPCEYAIVGLGSTSRKEVTLYSDFEHVIVLEDVDVNDSMREYFRWFSVIFQIIIIGLGETIIKSVDIKSFGDLYSNDESRNWFSDEYMPCGVSFDGLMPHACKIPLGRQHPTREKQHILELIQPVSVMANYLTVEEELKNGYFLKDVLSQTCFIYGHQDVYDDFVIKSKNVMSSERQEDVAKRLLGNLMLNPNESARGDTSQFYKLNKKFKAVAYRPMTTFLSYVSRVCGIPSTNLSSFEIIDELKKLGVIDNEVHQTLSYSAAVILEGRMKMYQKTGHQRQSLTHAEWAELVGERSAVDCWLALSLFRITVQEMLFKKCCNPQGHHQLILPPRNSEIWRLRKMEKVLPLGKFEEAAIGILGVVCTTVKRFRASEIDATEACFLMWVAFPTLKICFVGLHDRRLQRVSQDWFADRDPIFFRTFEFGVTQQWLTEPDPTYFECNALDRWEWACQILLLLKHPIIDVRLKTHQSLCMIRYYQKRHEEALQEFEKWNQVCVDNKIKPPVAGCLDMWMYEMEMRFQSMDTTNLLLYIVRSLASEPSLLRRFFLQIGRCQVLLKTGSKIEAKSRLYHVLIDVKKAVKHIPRFAYQCLLLRIREIQLSNRFFIHAMITSQLLSDTAADDFIQDMKWMSSAQLLREKESAHVLQKFYDPQSLMQGVEGVDNQMYSYLLSRQIYTSFSYEEMMGIIRQTIEQCRKQLKSGFSQECFLAYISSLMALFENVRYEQVNFSMMSYWQVPGVVASFRVLQPFIYGYLFDITRTNEKSRHILEKQNKIFEALFGSNEISHGWKLYEGALRHYMDLKFKNCVDLLWKLMHGPKYGSALHSKSMEFFLTAVVTMLVAQKRESPREYFSKTREISRKQVSWIVSSVNGESSFFTKLYIAQSAYYSYSDDPLVPVYNLAVECLWVDKQKCAILVWKLLHAPQARESMIYACLKIFNATLQMCFTQPRAPVGTMFESAVSSGVV